MADLPGATNVLLAVYGNLDDPAFHECRLLATAISEEFAPVTLDIKALVETDYLDFLQKKRKEIGADAYNHNSSPFVYYNGCNYIGGVIEFRKWARKVYEIALDNEQSVYDEIGAKAKDTWMKNSNNSFCYLEVQLVGEPQPSKVLIEMYDDLCPNTCDNFRRLCTGQSGRSYVGSPFHRVMKDGYVQGGDIDGGRGDGGDSASGGSFADEGFAVSHGRAGIVSMANTGPHTNKSQFFVTLKDMAWLDKKCVAFARVVFGMEVFNKINNLPEENQRPKELPKIVSAGIEEKKNREDTK
eukprot:g8347.t1